jgi:hypothetical protein
VLGVSSCCVRRPLSSSDIHTGIAVGLCSTVFLLKEWYIIFIRVEL